MIDEESQIETSLPLEVLDGSIVDISKVSLKLDAPKHGSISIPLHSDSHKQQRYLLG